LFGREPEEYVDFMAKYKDWIAIKRLGIRDTTKPEEVVHHLAAIRSIVDTKSYPMLGINTQMLDEHAKRLTEGTKKNYASLAGAINGMQTPETKRVLEQASRKELIPLAETYLLGKVISNAGFDTGINQTLMSKVFPDLKAPKVLGRHGKGKKE
jgi:hypothetical protein